jgi:hypothetical protein
MPSITRAKDPETASPETSLLGREIHRKFRGLLAKTYWTEDDLDDLLDFVPSLAKREEGLRKLRHVRQEGWTEDGRQPGVDPEKYAQRDPGANTGFRDWFHDFMKGQYGEFVHATQMDPLTKAAILSSSSDDSFLPYQALSVDVFTCWIRPGVDGFVIGVKGSGKTALACLLGRRMIDNGFQVLGPIRMRDTDLKGYWYCPSGTQLLRAFCLLEKQGVKSLVLLDEGAFSFSGETPLAREVMALRMFSRLFRKLGSSLLDITQYINDVPSELQRTAVFRAKKVSIDQPDRAHIQVRGLLPGTKTEFAWSGNVKWIPDGPPHTLPYVSKSQATFVMDFDPSALQEYLATLPQDADLIDATLHWLDEAGLHMHPRLKHWLARRCVRTCGLTEAKTAEILDVSQPTIHRWVTADERDLELDGEMLGRA